MVMPEYQKQLKNLADAARGENVEKT